MEFPRDHHTCLFSSKAASQSPLSRESLFSFSWQPFESGQTLGASSLANLICRRDSVHYFWRRTAWRNLVIERHLFHYFLAFVQAWLNAFSTSDPS